MWPNEGYAPQTFRLSVLHSARPFHRGTRTACSSKRCGPRHHWHRQNPDMAHLRWNWTVPAKNRRYTSLAETTSTIRSCQGGVAAPGFLRAAAKLS
eukprot:CAMPEP_0194536580 /NCGR_PEP_ID=MMETSP0253-20130528/75553_1 /TAXON_ID=2966 /ORGANISM="Noctiluca scintillans" /LENGTH=95 /DNA_ID=CAMNT_0039382517 /DNA_START=189 /DNA_END=476 /DNA_ORIENTATION=-